MHSLFPQFIAFLLKNEEIFSIYEEGIRKRGNGKPYLLWTAFKTGPKVLNQITYHSLFFPPKLYKSA